MHVVAKENDGKTIDFFVFDLRGYIDETLQDGMKAIMKN